MVTNTSWGGNRRSFPGATRRAILDRDHNLCRIQGPACTGKATEADHIMPWSQGGTDDISNGQAVCKPCHEAKTAHERRHGQQKHSRKREPMQHPGLGG